MRAPCRSTFDDLTATRDRMHSRSPEGGLKRLTVGVLATAVLAASLGGLWLYRRSATAQAPVYRFATATRGDVQATVAATGVLGAVTTVQVGTQVSGQVAAIYADFNDHVKKGQLLARIDPTLLQQSVQDAEASVERAQAQFVQAERDYTRSKQLSDAKVITASEFDVAFAAYSVAQANMKSASIALDKAKQNLAYTSIYAPIDGVIVERDVDVGQTVAASLSAPQLFLIANDLARMQILAAVDESDIGRIKAGQAVTFTVQTYSRQLFAGVVKQVRLQSKTENNVVNYTTVVTVENTQGKLLPGMTATVKFVTATATNEVLVPNAALRVQPTAAMLAEVGATAAPAATRSGGATATQGRLWLLDANGKLVMTPVETGLTDGQYTAVQGAGIDAGTKVIVGLGGGANVAAPSTTTNPLTPASAGRGGRGPGM